MGFLTFDQNNSGGSFDFDKDSGITTTVIIEGDDIASIIEKAETIGLYFDGEGDCPCCGDRWSEPYNDKLDETPIMYGMSPEEHIKDTGFLWMENGFNVVVHYKSGEKKWY